MIRVDKLDMHIGKRTLFSDLSFTLPDTGLVLIDGENGSGKTTLLLILAGLLKPSEGKIYYDDVDMSEFSLDKVITRKKNAIYLAPNGNFDNALTMGENMKLFDTIVLDGMPFKDRHPSSLSGGEMEMCVAYLVSHTRKKIVFMDEGLFYLDEVNIEEIFHLLTEASKTRLLVMASPRFIPLAFDKTIHIGDKK